MALVITALSYTGMNAQTVCQPAARKHSTATKPKTSVRTTNTITACRMLPYQVCSILPDRRSVSCYYTTDAEHEAKTGATTVYGPTGPMPGEVVHFKVRTIVVKGKEPISSCKRNSEDNATVCTQPGIILRDANGYYSYGEALPQKVSRPMSAK